MPSMALEGPTSVGERMRVKCLFCPQWMEGGRLSDHLKDFHRIAFHVGPPETSSTSTQTERHWSSRKRQEKRAKKKDERRKHKRAAPPRAPSAAATTSTPKKHQLEFKPTPFPVSSTAEAQTDDLDSTYMEVDNIKQESEVEPQQEYFEDTFQAQNPVGSESQSSDASQYCVDNQTDNNTQTEADVDTEEDSQVEESSIESRPKKHRKKATKRQRSLKKKTRSKYKNINSGASMMYSFVENAGDTIVDARNFSEAAVPHCPQINYTPTTPRKAKDINVIVRQQLARRAQSRLENRKPSVQKSPQIPENGASKEIKRLRDGLHELFSSAKVRRRVDATTRRQLPQKKSRRSKDRSRKNKVKVDANPLVRSRQFGQISPTKHRRGIPNDWSRLQKQIDSAKDSQEKKVPQKIEPTALRAIKTRQRGRPSLKTRSCSREYPSFPVSPREVNGLKDKLTGFFSPPRSTRSTGNRRSFKTVDSERAERNKMRLKKIKLAAKISSSQTPLDENKVGFEPNSKTTKLKQIEEEIERRRQIYVKSKLLPQETPRSSPRTKLRGDSVIRQKRARSVSGEGESEDGSPLRKTRRRRSTSLEPNSTPAKDSLRRNQRVERRSMRIVEKTIEERSSPQVEPRRKEVESSKLNEPEDGKEEQRDMSTVTRGANSKTIKYKICVDNIEMVDTPNISPKCRNRKMDPTTYLYSDTLKRRLRRRERAEGQTESPNRSSSTSKVSSRCSSVVPVQAWYSSHFACSGCSKKYNCRQRRDSHQLGCVNDTDRTVSFTGREAGDASSETDRSSKKEAECRTEATAVEENTKERNPKKSLMPEGGTTEAHPPSSKEQEIIIAVPPDLLRQLKQEESVSPRTTRPSVSTVADSVSSRCSSRCVTPHSIVSGPMKEMGEERRKKIKSMVRSLEEDGHPNFSLL